MTGDLLSFDADVSAYATQAEALLTGHRSGDSRLTLARAYCFRDWAALVAFSESVANPESAVYRIEAAVEAVISGDVVRLRSLLAADAGLVRARGRIRTRWRGCMVGNAR
ncbi:MAG: hypothetical protein SGI92_29525 [Bryobacteraceae bacterium]|nr:hypothetical protein [Bryobacteraceae bacterium]